jgi:tetratricopeptide (TPR) repeat protein
VIWGILHQHDPGIDQRLWPLLENPQSDPEQRFRAACALAGAGSAPVGKSWDTVSPFITDHFLATVIKNPGDYATLIETLRPIRKRLLKPLGSIFRDAGRSESERTFATTLLADYASDDPGLLADLLMDSDPKAFVTLFPVAEGQTAGAIPVLQAEIAREATSSWNDPPLDLSWTQPDPALERRIESAQGLVAERFAFCQTMPIAEFVTIAEGLRKSGYRPVRFRPYPDGPAVNVAAVWIRDGRSWRIAFDQGADALRQEDERNRKEKFVPVNVAGYATTGGDGKPGDRYAAVWVEKSGDEDARMYLGVTSQAHQSVQDGLKGAKLIPRTITAMRGSDGRSHYSGVWGRSPVSDPAWELSWDQSDQGFEQNQAAHSDKNLVDLVVSPAEPPRTTRERARASLETAERNLKAKPDDPNARFARATALIQLGEDQRALDDLNVVIGKAPQFAPALQHRALVQARLGKKKEALDDLAKFQGSSASESSKLYLAAVVAAELGEGREAALQRLESALKNQPGDAGLHYDAACAYALAAQAVDRVDKARGAALAERAVRLLQMAIGNGYSDYDHMEEDADLDPIRALPAFAELMKAGHRERRYASVWTHDARFEATPSSGLDPAAHLQQCRDLLAQGYRPGSLSVSRTAPDGPLVTASIWRRPAVGEPAKDALAQRQARAAAALIRLGHAGEVWPLLRHSADPRLRSFIVNWLNPLGADPKTLAAELARLDSSPRPAERGEGARRAGEGSSHLPRPAERGRGCPEGG